MDSIDLKLLRLLNENSKRTLKELGREVGLSVSAVRKRLGKLERSRVIKGYTVEVDHRKLGLGLTAFLRLEVDPKDLRSVTQRLSHCREVCEVHRITGNHNLLVKVRAKDVASLNKFLEDLTDSSGLVREIETLVAIESFKEAH
ncbi:MAG: Lrp/AsnC family transcriptional regulator [Candidatus Hadarchaeales archaeon]